MLGVCMKKLIAIIAFIFSTSTQAVERLEVCPDIEKDLSVQVTDKDDIVKICNKEYISYFSKELKIPVAVVEKLEPEDFTDNKAGRTNDFRVDPRIPSRYQLSPKQYVRSKYDKGHLAASSNTSDKRTVSQSYLMTNIVPQDPQLNRGTWKNMESFAKDLRKSNYHAKYVISGVIFDNCEVNKTVRGMPIADQMFKVVAHDRISTVFLIDNVKPTSANIMEYTSTLGVVNSRLCKVKIKFNPLSE